MEPTTDNIPETPVVFIRTRPQYALCNVYYYSIRFVNAAGDRLTERAVRSGKRNDAFWGLKSILEDNPSETPE